MKMSGKYEVTNEMYEAMCDSLSKVESRKLLEIVEDTDFNITCVKHSDVKYEDKVIKLMEGAIQAWYEALCKEYDEASDKAFLSRGDKEMDVFFDACDLIHESEVELQTHQLDETGYYIDVIEIMFKALEDYKEAVK